MFSRRKRLSRTSFSLAYKGKKLESPHFSVIASKNMHGYAVIVSKKTARLSVTRHKVKRRVLAALRSCPSLPPSLIVFPKSAALTLPYEEMRVELTALLSKI